MRRAALVVVALCALATAVVTPAVAQGAETGPVMNYTFEQVSGGTVPDVSGHGLDGRLVATVGARTLLPSLPGHGLALHLRGDRHEYVAVPLLPVLDVDHYTLAAWVRYTGVENDATNERWEVMEKAGAYWVNVRTNGQVRVGGFYGGCSGPGVWQYLDSAKVLPTNTWRHVAATYDGAVLKVYVGGTLSGSKAVSGRTCVSGEPLAVGAKNNPTKGLLEAFWDGRLDDVRIYDHALTAAQVRALAAR
jgi:hypothetical protein